MDTITHFSHEHPLHLLKQKPTGAGEKCYACEVPLTEEREHLVEVYGCELCHQFFLHKYCTQLPMEIEHKSHKNHSLFLVLKPPGTYVYKGCECRHFNCPETFRHRFFYYCHMCDFLLDTYCAFTQEEDGIVSRKKELIFHHPSHKQHPLMVLSRPASILCDACGVEDKDLFYHCPPCHYGIHKRCAMLQCTTTHDIHSHPLTLSFIGLPSQYRNRFHDYYCDICGDYLTDENNEFWLYYCELCRYFVHIRCMAKKKPQIEVDLKGLNVDELPHLPTSDNSVELIQRFLLENNSLPSSQQDISIFSHKHPLIYSDGQFMEDENEDGEEILCDACIGPILTPPYYRCAECRYFLHLACARLPQQFQHPSHPHQLILTSTPRFDETLRCDSCTRESNGFFFHCTTDGCEFNLDLKCASLPKVIVHAYHNHPLFHQMVSRRPYWGGYCKGCNHGWVSGSSFWCTNCNFFLHPQCALLPKTTKHRHDTIHPLILRFPPHAYHPKPFDCYKCEYEINPNFWLHHCEECDLSFHVDCFFPALNWYNMKFGQKVQIGSHPHPLKFVYEASVSSSRCHNCTGDDYRFTL